MVCLSRSQIAAVSQYDQSLPNASICITAEAGFIEYKERRPFKFKHKFSVLSVNKYIVNDTTLGQT
jgi:hypothetical protein